MMGLCVSVSSFAQSHSDHISVGIGALYQRGLDATISWEHETRYHNAWEYFINGYIKWDECASCGHVCPESFWNNYRTWGIGAAYKPCVARGRNNYGNLRQALATLGTTVREYLTTALGRLAGAETDLARTFNLRGLPHHLHGYSSFLGEK